MSYKFFCSILLVIMALCSHTLSAKGHGGETNKDIARETQAHNSTVSTEYAPVDSAALKTIDELTERLYLLRKQRADHAQKELLRMGDISSL